MKHRNDRIEELLAGFIGAGLAGIDLSLDRVTAPLSALGNPQNTLPPVVHVAGTNGKGSLIATLAAILQAAGYRVHRYSSPHLVWFNERIMLAGKEISDEYLLGILERVAALGFAATPFESQTAAAFLAFSETPADIVLLETGLGGRLDATNMVAGPMLTAITPISIDHKEYLGDTITAIAGEKAGIIKHAVPCVVGPQVAEAGVAIAQAAARMNAPLYRAGTEWNAAAQADGFRYRSSVRDCIFPLPALAGPHQIQNAATAIACTEQLQGFTITDAHIAEGILHAVWPARLQHIKTGALQSLVPSSSELWLDGGHNPGAGIILAEWVRLQTKPVHLICGMVAGKDTKQFLAPLAPLVKSFTGIGIEDTPNCQLPVSLCAVADALGIKNQSAGSAAQAIKHIVKEEKKDCIILICGSLYLAGNILWQNSQAG